MKTTSKLQASSAADAALGTDAIVTLFDPADPSSRLTVRLVKSGAAFLALAADAAALVDRIRLGLRPAFTALTAAGPIVGELLVRVRGPAHAALDGAPAPFGTGGAVVLEVAVAHVGPDADTEAPALMPRT